jgi:gliding motility-associated transport system ATP-binding protein
MISVKNLTKTFGYKTAVDDLSFEVENGEILGFLGPNGAGKTTTMRILTGFFPPTSGSASVNGVDVCEDSMKVREMVGYLPEHVPLYKEMTTREFLGFAASAKRLRGSARSEAIERTIERCNLEGVADQLIATLSRGYRQRVGLGQAIINNPKVLILDEPTVGLDPTQVRDIRTLLRKLGEDSTVILSSHILSEVQQMCNRVVIISQGRMQAMDTPENLTGNMKGESRVSIRVSGAEADQVQEKLSGLENVDRIEVLRGGNFSVIARSATETLAPSIANLIVGSGWELHELKTHTANLEDIFIQLVGQENNMKGEPDAIDPQA